MRDLTEVMGDAFEARARSMSGLAPTEPEVVGVKRRVRRRRAVRHVAQAAVTLPVVGAVVAAGWFGFVERTQPAPVATSTPTISPSPEPTPSPTPSSEPAPDPITEPGLPSYYPLPDGLLDQTGPGWVLATYLATDTERSAPTGTAETVFLVSPDGVRYKMLSIDVGASVDGETTRWTEHEVVSWDAGSRTALVRERVQSYDAGLEISYEARFTLPGAFLTLDLTTGAFSPAFEGPGERYVIVGEVAGGRLLWRSFTVDGPQLELVVTDADGGDPLVIEPGVDVEVTQISPDGARALVGGVVVDLVDGAVLGEVDGAGPAGWCESLTWLSTESVLAVCYDGDPFTLPEPTDRLALGARLVSLDVTEPGAGQGELIRVLKAGDVVPTLSLTEYVADGVVAFQGSPLDASGELSDLCGTGQYLLRDGVVERMATSDLRPHPGNLYEPRAVGRTVFVLTKPWCTVDIAPSTLSTYDLDTGASAESLGLPPVATEGPYQYRQGVTSYTVAP